MKGRALRELVNAARWCREHIEQYESIEELRRAVEGRPLNKGWKDYAHDLHSITHESAPGWDDGVSTPEEAWDLSQIGYEDAVEKAREFASFELKKLAIGEGPRAKMGSYYAGGSPNIARATMGLPRDMRRIVREPMKHNVVQIAYQASYSWTIDSEEVLRCGSKVIALVQALEMLGYSVQLSVVNLEIVRGVRGGFELTLKSFGSPLNIQKAAYFFAHPSFLRRIGFQWIERYPKFTEHDYGYGYPNDAELIDNMTSWMEERGGHFISFESIRRMELEEWFRANRPENLPKK